FLSIAAPCYASSPSENVDLPLVLSEAEQIALLQSPELQQIAANAAAISEEAIALGQLPDPKLTVGAQNVPTDTFSFTQDDMTMIEMGIEQEL
ncbi:TolC family protein, partial [Acinetobacter baumannii]